GVAYDLPMTELQPRKPFDWGNAVFGEGKPPKIPAVEGIYAGAYVVQPRDAPGMAPVQFMLISRDGKMLTYLAPAGITILDTAVPRVGILEQELTVGRTGPAKGYQLFLPAGVQLWITGRDGAYLRARLSADQEVWVPKSALRFLPAGTPPPVNEVIVARTQTLKDRVRIRVFLQQRIPFGVQQFSRPQRLILRLYGAISKTDWIRHDFEDPLVGHIQWKQAARKVYELWIDLNTKQQWGYKAYYEGNDLILEIRKPPLLKHGGSPLKNLLICVDPGHGPDLGAIGPTGQAEKDATLRYAYTLKQLLEKKGARVFLTREGSYGINLASRTKIAEAVNAHIFVSLHFNALPDGVNPFHSRGTSTYYYHTQSYPLAKEVQRQLLRKTRLPNFGLFYDNLAVCRMTWMPSILVEPAFIMHPAEEMKILDPKFQRKVCEGIVAGLEKFVKKSKN
ncbi:MAG: N-acetylmuramoyl-L-alanine amidase, partial [Calditrichaeota bacterium]